MRGEIVHNLSRYDYDRLPRINWSRLKLMARSPAHFRANEVEPAPDTAPKKVGRAVHVASLEPERFQASVALWDGERRAGKVWEAFKSQHVGQDILTENEMSDCMAISRAVRADATAAKYLSGGCGEVTMLWRHVEPGLGALPSFEVDAKGRVDFAKAGALVDLKTCRDASPDGFGRAAWSFKYVTQAADYVDGYEAATGLRLPYILIAAESAYPYAVQVYRLTDAQLELGRQEYRRLLERLHFCRTHNVWPGYVDGESELTLPKWSGLGGDEEDVTGMGLVFHQATAEG